MKKLSPSERQVMEWVWQQSRPVLSEELWTAFAQSHGWKQPTVSTFLSRLTKKGYLQAARRGRHFAYTPLLDERQYGAQEARRFAEEWPEAAAEEWLIAYARSVNDPEPLRRLRDWVTQQFSEENLRDWPHDRHDGIE